MQDNAPAPRRGGRPSQAEAGQIGDRILAIATEVFLSEGYGATSIEAIAKRARISKRTFYARFADKAELFRAVAHQLIAKLRPAEVAPLFTGKDLQAMLLTLAQIIIKAALSPQSLALHRLMIAESTRFPELAAIMDSEGARREAITHIGALLSRMTNVPNPEFAAEQFLQLVVGAPQRRALGLGLPMSAQEYEDWATHSVQLFLAGCLPKA